MQCKRDTIPLLMHSAYARFVLPYWFTLKYLHGSHYYSQWIKSKQYIQLGHVMTQSIILLYCIPYRIDQNRTYGPNSEKTPHTSPSPSSYEAFIIGILDRKIDCVIIGPHCFTHRDKSWDHYHPPYFIPSPLFQYQDLLVLLAIPPTNQKIIEFQIWLKYISLLYFLSYHNGILNISRLLCYPGMCKIWLWFA